MKDIEQEFSESSQEKTNEDDFKTIENVCFTI